MVSTILNGQPVNCTPLDIVPDEDKLIATAAANQTYGAQLTYLKTYYQALSDEEKVRSELRDSFGQIFPLTNLGTDTFSLFELYGPTNVNRISFIFSSKKVYQITSATNYDLTSETDTGSISLYVRNALGQVDGTMDASNVTYGDSNVDVALTELNSNISGDVGTSEVDITNYNSSNNQYVCPKDGYIVANSRTGVSGRITIIIGTHMTWNFDYSGTTYNTQPLYVRKGTRVYVHSKPQDDSMVYFLNIN